MKKKSILMLLFAALLLCMCACGKQEKEPEKEITIVGRWIAVTERPSGMAFNHMYFPEEMEFWSDGSFTEYYPEKSMSGSYVFDSGRLQIIEDMSAGVRDREWNYDAEISELELTLKWEDGNYVEYMRVDNEVDEAENDGNGDDEELQDDNEDVKLSLGERGKYEIINVVEKSANYASDGETLYAEFNYEYDENGNLVSEESFLDNGDFNYKITYVYDENNNKISMEHDTPDYNQYGDYIYDENNNLIEKKENGYLWKYYYNSDNQMIREEYYGSDGILTEIIEIEYDEEGKKLQKRYLDSDGTETGKVTKYMYDSDDNLVKILYSSDQYYEFVYDEHNNLINYDYYYNGELESKVEYSYDEMGNIIELKHYSRGEMFMIAKYSYKEIKVPKREDWQKNDIFYLDL